MKRRTILSGTLAAGATAAAASSFPAPAISQNRRRWRLVTTWPKNLPGLGTGAQYFADMVTRCTDGRLTVQLFAAGEVVPAFEAIDAVGGGTVEMGHGSPYYWKGKAPASEFVSNIPFGLTAQEYHGWYHFAGGKDLCDEVYRSQLNCKFFICGNTGIQFPGWSTRDVNSIDDIKGLKVRMPGIGGEIMRSLGATVVNLPGGEVVSALAAGAVEWVEWNNPYGEAAMGFWRHAKYYYSPGWHEPGTVLELFVNAKAWDDLPKDLQAIVEQCAYSTTHVMLAEFTARSAPVMANFIKEHGVVQKRLSDEIVTELGNAAGQVLGELASKDPLAGKVFASLSKYRAQHMEYSAATESDFLRARALPYKYPAG
ncbi:TRAP transporter substrate-binding protein [Azospirillum sp. ST 5-10]|uniref:TRAP transporter substrate-binding protein n=1 Tax=unclassified Azospirillum TaxID=2630922 RepID=UPI003F4A2845